MTVVAVTLCFLYLSAPAVKVRLVKWRNGYNHKQTKKKKKVLSIEEVKLLRETENGKKRADVCVCGEFGLVSSAIKLIWKGGNRIISVFEQNRSRIKWLLKPKRSDVDRALLKWFK